MLEEENYPLGPYRVVGLVDAQHEGELRDEEGCCGVAEDAGAVAVHGPQARQEEHGEQQEAQGHAHRAPGHQLHRQDLPVLETHSQEEEPRLLSVISEGAQSVLQTNMRIACTVIVCLASELL